MKLQFRGRTLEGAQDSLIIKAIRPKFVPLICNSQNWVFRPFLGLSGLPIGKDDTYETITEQGNLIEKYEWQ